MSTLFSKIIKTLCLPTLILCVPTYAMWRQAEQKISRSTLLSIGSQAKKAMQATLPHAVPPTIGNTTKNALIQFGAFAKNRSVQAAKKIQNQFQPITFKRFISTARPVQISTINCIKKLITQHPGTVAFCTASLIGATSFTSKKTPCMLPLPLLPDGSLDIERFKTIDVKRISIEDINKYAPQLIKLFELKEDKTLADKILTISIEHFLTIDETLLCSAIGSSNETALIKSLGELTLLHFTSTTGDRLNNIIIALCKDKELTEKFVDKFCQDFSKIPQNFFGVFFYLINNNPAAAQKISEKAIEHFTETTSSILFLLLQEKPELLDTFTTLAQENFKTTNAACLNILMTLNPSAAKMFTQKALENFLSTSPLIILTILEKNNDSLKPFTELALQNIASTPPAVLQVLLEKNSDKISLFTNLALKNISTVSSQTLSLILEKNGSSSPVRQKIKTLLKQSLSSEEYCKDHLVFLDHLNFYQSEFKECLSFPFLQEATITEQHFLHATLTREEQDNRWSLVNNCKPIVQKIIEAERRYAPDHYTFVHGQIWSYLLAEKFFTDLWGIHHDTTVKDYLFPHIRLNEEDDDEKAIHEHLLLDGRGEQDALGRQRLLFLNAPFFGNSSNDGSSTACYFSDNTNCSILKTSLKEVFSLYDDEKLYEKYQEDISSLEEEFKTLSNNHGNLLFIAIPKKLASEYVFLAKPGGFKKTLTIEGKETGNINLILDTLRTNPKAASEIDQNEYCLIMANKAMDPESGIKVIPFNAADPEKMASFEKKYQNLVEKIRTDIQVRTKKIQTLEESVTSLFA